MNSILGLAPHWPMKIDLYKKYKSVSVEIKEVPGGAILRRGTSRIDIGTPQGAASIIAILQATQQTSLTAEGICNLFTANSRKAVRELIAKLVEWRLLLPEELIDSDKESNLDIFYWNFQESSKAVISRFNKLSLIILGVNQISRSLSVGLLSSGFTRITIVDIPSLRNGRLFDEAGTLLSDKWPEVVPVPVQEETLQKLSIDCMIATSDFGKCQAMLDWNNYCIEHNINFFPVMLQDLIGYLGPVVVPKETACFQCTCDRINSNLEVPEMPIRIQNGEHHSESITGFHPLMPSVLGDIAAFNLIQFYIPSLAPRDPSCVLEVDLLKGVMTSRKVLKVPRCPACSSVNQSPTPALEKAVFIPPKGWEL